MGRAGIGIANVERKLAMADWIKTTCKRCTGPMKYLAHWTVRPALCASCRVQAIQDLAACLQQFIDHENRLRLLIRTPLEISAYAQRESLRQKVQAVLNNFLRSPEKLSSACIRDRDLQKLALRMSKERSLEARRPREPRHCIPKYIAPFLQGGAPGLGKKS